jgi:hypothetical protein
MGVYAMLDDETCWFLAIDFDKSTWEEDVRAVADTARRIGLPARVKHRPTLSTGQSAADRVTPRLRLQCAPA